MGTRAAALKRWRRPDERRRMSRLMKSRFRPKLKLPQHDTVPPEVSALIDLLGNELMEVVEYNHVRYRHRDLWSVAVIDGSAVALGERYAHFVDEVGLELFYVHPKRLPDSGGVSVVLFVSPVKGSK